MLRICCPFCGSRDEAEFRYRGDASQMRPAETEGIAAFTAYVYERSNKRGWQLEWWQHIHGCRKVLKLVRHLVTHEIAWVGWPQDVALIPDREPAP